MSSTSQALGPNEPPEPPNCVMGQPYRRRSGLMGGQVASSLPMSYPAALHLSPRPASAPGAGTVVFVHGSLDRGDSFRLAMRRLPEFSTLAYDRRGYQGSRDSGVVDLGGHIDDLLAIADAARADAGGGPVVAVGHSLGGDVVLGAALASPGAFAAIGAFEPPMPWLGFRRQGGVPWPPMSDNPGVEAERFFCRMVGEGTWARLTDERRAERRADGPALVADLRNLRVRGPALRRHRTPSALGLRPGWPPVVPPPPADRRVAGCQRPRRSRLRDRQRAAWRAPVAPRPLRRDDAPGA